MRVGVVEKTMMCMGDLDMEANLQSESTLDRQSSATTRSSIQASATGMTNGVATVPDDIRSMPERFLNRELSWLDFEKRLLDLADDNKLPLLERVKFLAIFSEALDEFFQVRVAGLKDQVDAGLRSRSPDGLWPIDQLKLIRTRVYDLLQRQSHIFLDKVVPALTEADLKLCSWSNLDKRDKDDLVQVFQAEIFPVLTPLAVDPSHPFPYISNLSMNLGVVVRDPLTGDERFARVKLPPSLPRFILLKDGVRFVPLEQLIASQLHLLFPQMEVGEHYVFRVTRNADLMVEEDEADDLRAAVELELRRRRFGRAVRLEIEEKASSAMKELLMRELQLTGDDVYEVNCPIGLDGLWSIYGLDRPDLHEDAWAPMTPPGLATAEDAPVDIFAAMRDKDVLVHHPYDSFATSVEAFISQAASDPAVLAIKQTLYRTSGDSPIVGSLIRAAEAGKQVVALVEVKARFDEEANIAWGRIMEEAGVHVVYGLVGLKTHAKAALVVRKEEDGIHRYCHIGTGNYNSRTARVYEDLGLLTANADIAADVGDLFNFLTGYSRHAPYRRLVIAPVALRSRILELIKREASVGPDGRITIKVNGLTDPAVIDALYTASSEGTQINLIVRGICCLRPGVPGLSDNITVRSIVGQFLEHSRIYHFGGVSTPSEFFIGSADLMERNLDRRIEALVPIDDPTLSERLMEILDLNLSDDTNAWQLGPDGSWMRVPTVQGLSTQRQLKELALKRARRRREADALSTL
ncbi:MAG: RNA degradosome polyphosphate kinase [Actinobacteria bacterium]|jgi:polyphosphate kinase|nr:RNA degradosome polyphosphate kinase [Actinomycetota bacterium]MCL6094209.1 RNA degradosome polyphosphate kinase [Actinomycetota bacterium]